MPRSIAGVSKAIFKMCEPLAVSKCVHGGLQVLAAHRDSPIGNSDPLLGQIFTEVKSISQQVASLMEVRLCSVQLGVFAQFG